jgi:phosphatidylserine decarboxylase precursor-related protein
MVRDAYPILVPLVVLAVVCVALAWFWQGFLILAALPAIGACFVAYFFRDPERVLPADPRLIVAPADGRIVRIEPVATGDGGDTKGGTLVSIFLSIFDVHVNRSPIAGRITGVKYQRGSFRVAMDHRASVENEQNIITVEGALAKVIFTQIAGLIARRIVFWKEIGSEVALGERIGLIKFGSRVDVLLPPNVVVTVRKGEHVKGGVSVIGNVKL